MRVVRAGIFCTEVTAARGDVSLTHEIRCAMKLRQHGIFGEVFRNTRQREEGTPVLQNQQGKARPGDVAHRARLFSMICRGGMAVYGYGVPDLDSPAANGRVIAFLQSRVGECRVGH